MRIFGELLRNFFTHRDFLPSFFANCRKVKNGIAMLLAVMALSCLLPVSANGAGAYTIRFADAAGNSVVTAKPGQQVTLLLSIENNPGIIGVGVQMHYPMGLSLLQRPKNLSALDAVADGYRIFSPDLIDNPYLMWWNYALGDYNRKLIHTNGNLAEITFAIAADATAGDYMVTLSAPSDKNTTAGVDGGGIIKKDTNTPIRNIKVVGCTIRVEGASSTQPTPGTPQPKPNAPEAPKPTVGATDPSKPTKATDPTSPTTVTTQPATDATGTTETTQVTAESTSASTEPAGTVTEIAETNGKGKREPMGLPDTPAARRILVALGITLATGGALFFILRKKPYDDEN